MWPRALVAVFAATAACGGEPWPIADGDDQAEPDAAPICRTCDERAVCSPAAATPCACPPGLVGDGTVDGSGCVAPDASPGPCASAGCGLAGCDEVGEQATCEIVYAANVRAPMLWLIDPDRLATRGAVEVAWADDGPALRGLTALATDPTTGTLYAVTRLLSPAADTNRRLVTIELAPGRATLHDVGALGTRFSALAFARDGRLFGVTGDGTVPGETLFEIDPRSAAVTSLRMLGAGGDGEALAYDAGNNRLLHWSGDDLHVVEAISLAPPYATTELAMDMPAPARETSAAVALGGGSFLTATMTRRLVRWRGDGTAEVLPGETNVGHRGLARIAVAPGDFALEPATTSTRGGALVTVRGWFVPSDVVGLAVDGVAVPLASASATALTFVAPPHGAGDAPIVVTTTVAGPLDGGTLTYAD